jgi:hypothetical protein
MPKAIRATGQITDQFTKPVLEPRNASPIKTRITPRRRVWLCTAGRGDAGGRDALAVGAGGGETTCAAWADTGVLGSAGTGGGAGTAVE